MTAATLAGTYLLSFLALTAFLLFTILPSEIGNSLLNPVDGLVLARLAIYRIV